MQSLKYCFSKTFLKTLYVFNSFSKRESTSRKKFEVQFKKLKQNKRFDINNDLRDKQKVLVLELKNKCITEAQTKLQVIRLTKYFYESIFRSDNIKIEKSYQKHKQIKPATVFHLPSKILIMKLARSNS